MNYNIVYPTQYSRVLQLRVFVDFQRDQIPKQHVTRFDESACQGITVQYSYDYFAKVIFKTTTT